MVPALSLDSSGAQAVKFRTGRGSANQTATLTSSVPHRAVHRCFASASLRTSLHKQRMRDFFGFKRIFSNYFLCCEGFLRRKLLCLKAAICHACLSVHSLNTTLSSSSGYTVEPSVFSAVTVTTTADPGLVPGGAATSTFPSCSSCTAEPTYASVPSTDTVQRRTLSTGKKPRRQLKQ